jgi:hypothetical protein
LHIAGVTAGKVTGGAGWSHGMEPVILLGVLWG